MPVYEYECPKHGRFEIQQRITENALTICVEPACGEPVRKLISNTSFALKGGGWYSDLYSSSGKSGGGGKSEAKSDTSSAKAETCGTGACGAGACAAPKAQA